MDTMTSCAFTGHRPHKLPWGYDEADERCAAVKGALAGQIAALAARGVTDYYTGMARGTDIWASQAVLDLKERLGGIRLRCVLPHLGQDDRWPGAAQELYRGILARADEVVTLSDRYYDGCLLARNRYMVDRAAYLLAVYDGSGGGTGYTVRYAGERGRRVIVIDPVRRVIRHALRQ